MKTSLTQGLSKERAQEVVKEFATSPVLRERLIEICKKKISTSNTYARSKDRYESPSWALIQSDAIGYERAFEEIISLLTSSSVSKD